MSAAQDWIAPAESMVPASASLGVVPGDSQVAGMPRIVRAVATLAAACLLTAAVLIVCAAVVSRWG